MAPLILVFGRTGQLAQTLLEIGPPAGFAMEAIGSAEANLVQPGRAESAIRAKRPAIVINASAFTNVDAAEIRERDAAQALNASAPAEMARACAEAGAAFVHVSTDFVFDGAGGAPYREDAPTNPLNHYGATKRAGEEAVLATGANAAILRTAWVFGPVGANFILGMLKRGAEHAEVMAADDQFNRPTAVDDLARGCLAFGTRLLDDPGARGLWHFAGAEDASRAEWLEAAFAAATAWGARLGTVKRVPASTWTVEAPRPRDSRLDSGAAAALLGAPVPSWKAGLERMAARLYA